MFSEFQRLRFGVSSFDHGRRRGRDRASPSSTRPSSAPTATASTGSTQGATTMNHQTPTFLLRPGLLAAPVRARSRRDPRLARGQAQGRLRRMPDLADIAQRDRRRPRRRHDDHTRAREPARVTASPSHLVAMSRADVFVADRPVAGDGVRPRACSRARATSGSRPDTRASSTSRRAGSRSRCPTSLTASRATCTRRATRT